MDDKERSESTMAATGNPAASGLPSARAETAEAQEYRSARTRAVWAQSLLATTGGLAVIGGYYFWQGAGWLVDDSISQSEWESWVSTVDGLSNIATVATIGMVVALLLWLHRTVRNAPAVGNGTPPTSPGWSVGWWFVPVANFWKPYAILRDLWDRFVGPGSPRGWLVGAWWATWLVAILGTRVIGAAMGSTTEVADFQALLYWAAATDALAALAAVAGVLMVHEIQQAADRKARALGFDPPGPPRPSVPTPYQGTAAPSDLAGSHGPPATAMAAASPAAFCHQCGQRRVPGDRFCATCGAALRDA